MKKIMAVILSLVIAAAMYIPTFAVSGIGAKDIVMGDLDYDKKITVTDARIALRTASKLETNNFDPNSYDADGNGKLTVTDARIILRVAAKLQNFDFGFDVNGAPNVIKVFKTGEYAIDASINAAGENADLNFVVSKKGIYMGLDGFIEGSNITGMLMIDKNFYATGTSSSGKRTALAIPADMMNDLGEDLDMSSMLSELSQMFSFDFDSVSEDKTLDGKDAICYAKLDENGTYSAFFADYNGRLIEFEGGVYDKDKDMIGVDTVIKFNSLTGNIDNSIFDISTYVVM